MVHTITTGPYSGHPGSCIAYYNHYTHRPNHNHMSGYIHHPIPTWRPHSMALISSILLNLNELFEFDVFYQSNSSFLLFFTLTYVLNKVYLLFIIFSSTDGVLYFNNQLKRILI